MGPRIRATCRVSWLVALTGCNTIFGLDAAGADASTDGVRDAATDASADAAVDAAVDAAADAAVDAAAATDASADAAVAADAAPDAAPCTWQTSNVNACALVAAFAPAPVDWTLGSTETTLDTSLEPAMWTDPGGIAGGVPVGVDRLRTTTSDGQQVAVLIVQNLNVPSTASLSVRGDRPLVILVTGTATIDGIVSYDGVKRGQSMPANGCPGVGESGHANSGFAEGSGGGGGSLGGAGKDGGNAPTVAGGIAGMVSASPLAVPLFMGCDGGAGGYTGATSGLRGRGGGAVQISAATQILFSGTVSAGGAGGPGGSSKMAGGAGGGSGGTILLEAPAVMLTTGAWNPNGPRLCANGGGGGGGADPGVSVAGGDGTAASCLDVAAAGGSGMNTQAPGGNGASQSTIATGGAATATSSGGGGGGGGGLGTIRLNGMVSGMASVATPVFTTGATATPPVP